MSRRASIILLTLCVLLTTVTPALAQSYIMHRLVLPFAAEQTWVSGSNDLGQLVGAFMDSTTLHGFLYDKGQFAILDVPFAGGTFLE